MRKRALITGVTGQDGYYLSLYLDYLNYDVYGLVRRTSQGHHTPPPKFVQLIPGDVTDPGITRLVAEMKLDEIYNLAAMSHVGESFKIPHTTFEVNALGTLNVLEAARQCGARFYQASTSELFGMSQSPQDENTPMHPRSPYGVAKLAAYWLTRHYREAYGVFAANGILFNHESPKRGADFVTQKICQGVARIYLEVGHKLQRVIRLGNLDARRDWGHAFDYVRGMHAMLQCALPDDFVLATGETHSVREFLDAAFAYVGIKDWAPYVKIDKSLFRPAEVNVLCGNATKAKMILGWKQNYSFTDLVNDMMAEACKRAVSPLDRDNSRTQTANNPGNRYLDRPSCG